MTFPVFTAFIEKRPTDRSVFISQSLQKSIHFCHCCLFSSIASLALVLHTTNLSTMSLQLWPFWHCFPSLSLHRCVILSFFLINLISISLSKLGSYLLSSYGFPGCALSSVNIAWITSMLLVTWLFPSCWSPFYVMQLGHQPCNVGVLECRDTNIEVSQGTVFKAAALPALCLSPWCKYVTGRGSLCALRQKKAGFYSLCVTAERAGITYPIQEECDME